MRRTCLAIGLLSLLGPGEARADLQDDLASFAQAYAPRFGEVRFVDDDIAGCGEAHALDSAALRDPATGPVVLDHGDVRENAIVLIHGLSDSPFFLCALARALFEAGANVVLPLLTGHGRVQPSAEAHVPELAERWKVDAEAALAFAERRGKRVSVGGLSTGGLLAVWLWAQTPDRIDGGLLLFSGAFDFERRLKLAAACAGTAMERQNNVLRRWCNNRLVAMTQSADEEATWNRTSPYRDLLTDYGALQLGLLRRSTLQALDGRRFDPPLLIAHSIHDDATPIAGVDALAARHEAPALVERFTIDDVREANCLPVTDDCTMATPPEHGCGLPHASVVLAAPLRAKSADAPVCEPANPVFEEMAAAAVAFIDRLP